MNFLVAFVVSFMGSIPPGSINLSVLQLGLGDRLPAAVRFSLAAALIEIPYALIAIKFQNLLESSPWLMTNFKLIAAVVLLVLGILSFLQQYHQRNTTSALIERIQKSGFRRGLLVGVFNPLAIPFWIGVTAYLKQHHWIRLDTTPQEGAYVGGLALGTFVLLVLLAYLSRFLAPYFQSKLLALAPAVALILLSLYSFAGYINAI